MATVVVDSTDIVAHTQMRAAEADEAFALQGGAKPEPKAEEKPEVKAEAKEDPKGEAKPKVEEEDENGLTEEQRKGLSEKMLRAIGKKHRQLKEAEEFAAAQFNEKQLALKRGDQLEAELRRLKTQADNAKPAEVAEDTRPKRDKYETQEAYEDALADWKYDQRRSAEKAQEAKDAQERERGAVIASAQAAVERAKELVPDWAETIEAANVDVPPHIQFAMLESDKFAELGLHFAKNPDDMARLAKLTPGRALVELGKIEDKIEPFSKPKASEKAASSDGIQPSSSTGTSRETPAPRQSRESAPIVPLNAGSASQVEPDPRTRTYAEEREAWQKRTGVNLQARKRH
jgi:hypothetical protein